ncbi:alpha/beta fold hydrolase [Streptomyces sp. TRM66268-LWL]|uniref:Alpha/beta fold hydrolase n=1 Tax=Streptomyces polyasparticus TaxID=2767826 RepID=A0ABR7SNJ9_9ACTN|nr:alpha/beta fold hydrolase [Streptomyces polyasparticus]MBC9716944.1 alpha/beta fold hydrolase [Streptomyces polyasparticus]
MDLRLPGLKRARTWPRSRRLAAAGAALAVLVGAGTWTAVAADDKPAVRRTDAQMRMDGASIDTSYFTAGSRDDRRPAVLIGHGFGGSKEDVRAQAERLAARGYAVLTWSARGFGKSTGRIGLNDPKAEVADVSKLIDWLAARPEVQLDKAGDPRVGLTGPSYGGAISLLAAGHDQRVDAIAPLITYWNLAEALFPNGVFKKLWAGIFLSTGGGCDRFEQQICEMYNRVAVAGKPDAKAKALLEERSPSAVGDRIKVPTLILQGQTDSLFPLGHADEMAKTIGDNGGPVAVDWIAGGHDGGDMEGARADGRVAAWFDRYLKQDKGADTGPAFRVTRTGGVDSTDGRAQLRGATDGQYPGLDSGMKTVPLHKGTKSLENPAGSSPPAISTVPGLGGGLGQLSSLGLGGLSLDFPGQFAAFDSAPLGKDLRITGSPTARVRVQSDSGEAVLFAKVYDVGPGGQQQQVLPSQLVSPVRVTDAEDGREVDLTLPAIDYEVQSGHKLRLALSSTDLGFASPVEPATYKVTLLDDLSVPTAPGVKTAPAALPAWVWALPLAGVALAAGLLLTARRRVAAPPADPALAEVPLQITDLSKKYGKSDRYSVRDLGFRVEKGQVLGLLGPNGAGKTTTLRMLMGLIRPDEGEIRVFGHAIRPGAPVLSRVGAFVEGAGFLPHLSGRENLELYWAATGRPAADAHLDEALEIAGLGDALARAVRTYSQGMRQRLAIAQAMLGLPDLLILDEPTNGLDPPQIREMREVMIRYAAAGRTVIVSSHLLSEVEQSCTHLVVMDRGQLVQAGPVAEIVGSGDMLLVSTSEPVTEAVAGKIEGLPGIASAAVAEGGLLVRLDGATVPFLLAELLRLEVPVTGVGPHRRLEDAFLNMIGGSA